MADNLDIKDGGGNSTTLATKEAAGVHKPKHYTVDGDHETIGAKADSAVTNPSSSASLIALLKGIVSAVVAEDVASSGGDFLMRAGVVRKDTPANLSGTDGDYELLQVAAGRLWTSAKLEAGELHLGQVGGPCDLLTFAPTLDTSAYTAGDVLFATTAVSNAFRTSGGQALLQSVTVYDKEAQAQEIDLIFFVDNTALGSANSAPSLSDADALKIIGTVKIQTTDYIALGSVGSLATVFNKPLLMEPTTGTTLYVAGITRGTPTHTSSGLQFRLGVVWS